MNYKFNLIINWLPGFNQESAKEKLTRIKDNSNIRKCLFLFTFSHSNPALWERLLEYSAINKDLKWNNMSGFLINKLAIQLTQ